MKQLLKTLIRIARFLERAAESLRQRAIDRLENDKALSYKREAEASKRQTEAWNAEIKRHQDELAAIQRKIAAHSEYRKACVDNCEQKIKEIEVL